jgi:ubiquinone/menaquinone biosynthesis C-methylase UbiE
VDLYAKLPAWREPSVIHEAAGAGASILDLGSGAGRVTAQLVALGHPVTAVDESPQMLALVSGAETVCARIEELDLPGREFHAVVLGSYLLNLDSDDEVPAYLATCRRHVMAEGCVLIEHHSPAWFDSVAAAEHASNGFVIRVRDVVRHGPGLLSATIEHEHDGRAYAQHVRARRLDEARVRELLASAGLRFDGYLTDDQSWFRAIAR